jgi:hypothetical protein
MSGYLVLVYRLVAGVLISGVRGFVRGLPIEAALLGLDEINLATIDVNVNMKN